MYWAKILPGYAESLIYKPGHIHSASNALLHIPAPNTLYNTNILYEAIRRA